MIPEVVHETALIHAPLDRLWKLSTRVELVKDTLGMNFAGGQTTGFVHSGSRVVWKGWKFGLPTEHHTLISGYEPPRSAPAGDRCLAWFQDRQERGRFASFQHDHWLRETLDVHGRAVTQLEDEVRFSLPLGTAGRLVARVVMTPYIRRLVKNRFARLKVLAEGEGWRQWM